MPCCTGPCPAAAHFDPRVADRDLRRYQRHGPDLSTRLLLSELQRWPLQGLHLLDVGSGIGVIPLELAAAGLACVTLADASPAYLEAARRHLASREPSRPAQFVLGDFAATAASLPDADIVTLDRVVCCYPDVEALLRGAAARARRMVAFTYHPDRVRRLRLRRPPRHPPVGPRPLPPPLIQCADDSNRGDNSFLVVSRPACKCL